MERPPDYINRELSWLEFNRRVLEEAKQESVPLLERVKFLAIFSSNLDEFFMVRVARLKRLIFAGDLSVGPDGWTHAETLTAISTRVHELAEEQHLCFLNTIMPQLSAEEIHLVRPEEMSGEQERFLEEYFHRTLYPIVTPLAIDPGHPFPYLANRSLCLVVSSAHGSPRACRTPIFRLSISRRRWRRDLFAAQPRRTARLHAVGRRLAALFAAAVSRL